MKHLSLLLDKTIWSMHQISECPALFLSQINIPESGWNQTVELQRNIVLEYSQFITEQWNKL